MSMNFGGIEEQFTDYHKAPVVMIPVPFDATSTWIRGADRGPEAILEASANMELYDIQTSSEVYLNGIHTMAPVGATLDGKFPVVIGGNHSVCIGPIRACSKVYEKFTVLQLDAHTDLRPEYEGTPLSHASVMSRAREVTHVVQVGIRSMCVEEVPFIEPENIFYAHDIVGRNDWYEQVASRIEGPVYLTIDLDVFDPSVLPSTGTPEPGGMVYYEVYRFLRYIIDRFTIIGMDVNELCPIQGEKSSDFLASKLIYQIISLLNRK
jgi:agmatinase